MSVTKSKKERGSTHRLRSGRTVRRREECCISKSKREEDGAVTEEEEVVSVCVCQRVGLQHTGDTSETALS